MKRLLPILLVCFSIAFCINFASSVPIFVNIAGDVDGTLAYSNVSILENMSVVEVVSVWENTGSAGCKTYMRIDVEDANGSIIYTSWSNVERVAPGGIATFRNYWFFGNLSGNFTLIPTLYFCDEIKRLNKTTLQINGSNYTNMSVIRVASNSWIYENDPSTINVEITLVNTTSSNLKDFLVLPLTIPPGDKVYAARYRELELEDGVLKLQINWDYGVLTTKKIPMVLIDSSGGKVYRFDVLPQIREEEKRPSLPIVLLIGRVVGMVFGFILSKHLGSDYKNIPKSKKRTQPKSKKCEM